MPTIPEMVAKIRELYSTQLPPADAAQLERADAAFRSEFGIGLPDDYRELLEQCNGIGFNGVLFYSTEDGETRKGAARFGIGEANERLIRGVHEIDTTLRFVGETGNQLFGYDRADGKWKEVDRTSWDLDSPQDVYDSFTDLFTAQFDTFVDW